MRECALCCASLCSFSLLLMSVLAALTPVLAALTPVLDALTTCTPSLADDAHAIARGIYLPKAIY